LSTFCGLTPDRLAREEFHLTDVTATRQNGRNFVMSENVQSTNATPTGLVRIAVGPEVRAHGAALSEARCDPGFVAIGGTFSVTDPVSHETRHSGINSIAAGLIIEDGLPVGYFVNAGSVQGDIIVQANAHTIPLGMFHQPPTR
jgi:hypothetical protein